MAAPPSAVHATTLEPYGTLFTTSVVVAGVPRRFLVDTAGGMTVFTPALAAQAGCTVGGPLTGFRMSGERIDAPRCEGATVTVGGWASPPHTVMVLDINALLPPDWPRLDGLLSLATFEDQVVTVDLAGRRLGVGQGPAPDARRVRVRFEHAMTGLSRVAFVATRQGTTDLWLEVDTGSDSALLLNESFAPVFGLTAPVTAADARTELRIDDGAPVPTQVQTARLIFDGNLGLATMRPWTLTFDLAQDRLWIRTPPPAS